MTSQPIGLTGEERHRLKMEIDRCRRRQLRIVSADHDLRELLAAGPRDGGEIVRALQAAGHTAYGIRKAASRLGVDRRGPSWVLREPVEEPW